MSRAAKTAPTPTSPITAVATGIAQTVLAQTSNRQLKLPNNLHRSTDAVSRSRPAWPSANALRQLAFTQAHRPRRSNPHRFSIPRFPPLEVFRRRPPEYRAITVSGRHPKTFTFRVGLSLSAFGALRK